MLSSKNYLRVDGDDLPSTAPHHENTLQALGQNFKELHVCNGDGCFHARTFDIV